MRRGTVALLLALSVVLIALGACARPPGEATGPELRKFSKQVLAFYYGWYGNPDTSGDWRGWRDVDKEEKNIANTANYPMLGAYDSRDQAVVEQHFRWAKQAGITAFIRSWWRPEDFSDDGMQLFLDTAQQHDVKVTIYYETAGPRDNPTPAAAIDDLLYLLERYGKHAAWMKQEGKPVVFVYGRAVNQIKLEGWRQVTAEVNRRYAGGAVFIGDRISEEAAGVFDGIHTYNPTPRTARKSIQEIRAWAAAAYPEWVRTAGPDRIACVTVIPGYDDTNVGRKGVRPTTYRYGDETYRVLWEEAIKAGPDWVLITSWNEWYEGSEIEPSVENGEIALRTTSEMTAKFLTLPTRAD